MQHDNQVRNPPLKTGKSENPRLKTGKSENPRLKTGKTKNPRFVIFCLFILLLLPLLLLPLLLIFKSLNIPFYKPLPFKPQPYPLNTITITFIRENIEERVLFY